MLLFAFRGRFKTLKGILVNVNVDGVEGDTTGNLLAATLGVVDMEVVGTWSDMLGTGTEGNDGDPREKGSDYNLVGGKMEEEEEEELGLPSFGRVVARLCEVEDCCVRNRRTGPLNKSLFFSKMGMELGV
jgi:hypothetical protein